jgi:hypothetical protein
MPKRLYVMAVVCYLAIPVVVICGVGLFVVIDPGIARGRADYARTYRLVELARLGVLAVTAGLALLLWTSCCYRVLKSRQRSLRWLSLAAAGPVGFGVIAALEDRSPAPGDRYQRMIRNLKTHWRVPVEIGVLVAVWVVAHESVVLEHAPLPGASAVSAVARPVQYRHPAVRVAMTRDAATSNERRD